MVSTQPSKSPKGTETDCFRLTTLAKSSATTGGKLLAVALSDHRLGQHGDAGLCAVDACLPGTGGANESAVLVLLRVLAEVPDVAFVVRREPVEGPLDQFGGESGLGAARRAVSHTVPVLVQVDPVVNHDDGDTENGLAVGGHGDFVQFRAVVGLVVVGGSRHEREVWVGEFPERSWPERSGGRTAGWALQALPRGVPSAREHSVPSHRRSG